MLHILLKQSICQICTSQTNRYLYIKTKKMDISDSLFHSALDILNILERHEHRSSNGVQDLLHIYQNKKDMMAKNNVSGNPKYPLIILEGLDGCGKTSVGRRFAARIGAQQWKTPPESIAHLRNLFDEHIHLRTAYYSLGNYVAAMEVQNLLETTPVVMDRFWHSTAAYAIAQTVQDHPDKYKMPLPGDKIYSWPEDLLKPDIVIFLDVSEVVRKQRQSRRTNVTMQEGLLNNSDEFRENVTQAYKNMINPGVVFINGDLPFNKTLAKIDKETKHLFKNQNI